jgi:gamma-glutamyltranspeptidase / glutathione hydrolase
MPVAIAAPNVLAAEAAADSVRDGGDAVDAALVGILMAALTEPGICSLAGGGFVTLASGEGPPMVLDGYAEMPGRGLEAERFGGGVWPVTMAYGGGMETLVGPGTVATPGGLAAVAEVADRWGRLPWRRLLEPVIAAAREGFPLSAASDSYLEHSAGPVYGWDPTSRAVLFDGERRRRAGERIVLPELADLLEAVADEGIGLLHRGEAGAVISDHVLAGGGILTRKDLAEYRPRWRTPLTATIAGRHVNTNPGPAVGGAALLGLLELTKDGVGPGRFEAASAVRFADAQMAVFTYRLARWSHAAIPEVAELVALSRAGDVTALSRSASTVHVSAVGTDGVACAVTFSAGYGSGVMAPGTGLWLNNSLGELELTQTGFHTLEPGTRLVSNMAPSVVIGDDSVTAIGSPGADRITSAIATTLLAHLQGGLDLESAVAHPRLHVELNDGDPRVALEPGMPYPGPMAIRPFDDLHMYFGGVGVAEATPTTAVAAADPRRSGAVRVVP